MDEEVCMHSVALPDLKLSFDSVFYYVNDMNRSIAFYGETLGLPMISRDFVARFDINGMLFEQVPTRQEQAVSGAGNARVCFKVQNIEETVRQLRARGVETGEIKPEKGGLLAFFKDPDGNELCLWQYTTARPKQT
jgi:catechol 2,3-dioxygenase-like lactoylglutathione lyase family enzyme